VDSSSPGVMLNISSTGSLRPRPGLVWYNASKAAVSNATKALAAEYGPKGIRVNAICPLLGATGLFETFTGLPNTKENQAAFLGNVPMGRLCTPNDVSSAALFLCSDEAAFVTGVCMEVDGGKCV
jgi:NAD(P)-dependent dehydrogenase (short-subunit alcohol dehydrogenase family)